ncbi:MAG: glycosyltransferase [Armatimonadetes bacterium]|nr:glycosyltransferase [Armatimonadota bacterium]
MRCSERTAAPYRTGHVIDDLFPAGAQLVLKLVLRNLDPAVFTSFVYTFRDGEIGDQIRDLGIPVTVLGKNRKIDVSLILRLARKLRDDGIQLLNAHIFGAITHGYVAALMAGVPHFVATEHNVNDFYPRWRRIVNRLVLPQCEAVVAVSQAAADGVGRLGADTRRVLTIPNGIDLERFAHCREQRAEARERMGVPQDALVIGNVAHLQPQKNQVELVHAVHRLRSEGHNAYLVVVGADIGDGPRVRGAAETLGVSDQVRLLGKRDDVPVLLGGMDLFALSSLWEGLPMSLLEAMAAGLPCVSTEAGGIPSVISSGENGILVPTGDREGLIAAIRQVVTDPCLGQRMAENARKTVEQRFSDRTMARAYQELYLKLLERRAAGVAQQETAAPTQIP